MNFRYYNVYNGDCEIIKTITISAQSTEEKELEIVSKKVNFLYGKYANYLHVKKANIIK